MAITDRKPKKYSTSDLFWVPSAAPEDGTVGDVNTMKLSPDHLGMAQDVIIGADGVLRSRGGLIKAAADHTGIPLSIIQARANTAMLSYDSTNTNFLYGSSNTTLTGFSALNAMGEDSSQTSNKLSLQSILYRWDAVKYSRPISASLNPGAIFCGANYANPGNPSLSTVIWGGSLLTNDTTTGTFTSTRGSTTVTGVGTSWTTALEGAYLFNSGAGGIYIGQVYRVTGTTAIILVEGALASAAGIVPRFKASRMMRQLVYKGRITCNTASTSVIGSGTKFLTSSPNISSSAPSYLTLASRASLFRASDGAFVGEISSVQNDTTCTLFANAAVSCVNEEYYAVPSAGGQIAGTIPTNYFAAACSEVYSDRYWYGCYYAMDVNVWLTNPATGPPTVDSRIWATSRNPYSITFSKKFQPEYLDVSATTGDVLTFPSVTGQGEEVRALKATKGGMLIMRGVDTYFLTGYSPETFRTVKILDDGVIGANCAKKYGEGVIWAGNKSIYYFDGTKIVDLLNNKIKNFYNRTIAGLGTNDAGSGVAFDHFIFSYKFGSPVTWPYKNTTTTVSGITVVVNMLNGAVSFFTNLFAYNSVDYLLNGVVEPIIQGGSGTATSATSGQFLKGSTLFNESSTSTDNVDAAIWFQTVSNNLGPQVMFESVKLSNGNAARLKFWKMLLMNYSSDVAMSCSIISNNDTTLDFPNTSSGTVTAVNFPVSSNIGILKRIKFLIRTPTLMFRVYQTNTTSATSQRFKMFWYAVGGKWMRWGRQQ